jgi:hypothetical protein
VCPEEAKVSSATASDRLSESAEAKPSTEILQSKRLATIAWGSLFLAGIEAACATFIALNGFSLAIGTGSIVLARWATYLHNVDAIRRPALALATLGAVANVLVVANGLWLRRAPSARWRYRPLRAAERRRILLTLGSAAITLAIVAAELFEHKALHGHY